MPTLSGVDYPTGTKVSDKEMKDLSVRHHDTQPNRNYTDQPQVTGYPKVGSCSCVGPKTLPPMVTPLTR